MIYSYECESCGSESECSFKIGEALPEVECSHCGKVAKRSFVNAGFVLRGPGDHWPTQQLKRKREMTRNNEEAGQRGYNDWKQKSPKLVDQ